MKRFEWHSPTWERGDGRLSSLYCGIVITATQFCIFTMSSEAKSTSPEHVLLEDLSTFFDLLDISKDKIEAYVAGCTKNNINNFHELRELASLKYLQETGIALVRTLPSDCRLSFFFTCFLSPPVSLFPNPPRSVGISHEHAILSMKKMFEMDFDSSVAFQSIPRRRDLLPPRADGTFLLTRNNLVILVSW